MTSESNEFKAMLLKTATKAVEKLVEMAEDKSTPPEKRIHAYMTIIQWGINFNDK